MDFDDIDDLLKDDVDESIDHIDGSKNDEGGMSKPLLDAVPISDINCTEILRCGVEHDTVTLKDDELSTSGPESLIDGREKDCNESQIEEIYLSSGNGENTGDSDIILTKNNDINTEIPKDDNHEEVKSKSRASSENIPSDPKNGNVKGFPQRQDDKAELKLG